MKMCTGKHTISLSSIFQYFHAYDDKSFKRGENSYNSGHVLEVQFDKSLGIIRGQVYASMKDKKYKVEIWVNSDGEIVKSMCTCPRGLFVCHHMAAICIHGHYNISSTNISCFWSRKKPQSEAATNVADMYPMKKPFAPINENQISDESVQKLMVNLKLYDRNLGITWLHLAEPESEDEYLVLNIEKILLSTTLLEQTDQSKYLKEVLKVSTETILKVATKTVGQSSNPLWLTSRKHRITASNSGCVIKACEKNSFSASLFKRLTGSYDLDKVKAIQWRRQHEKDSLKTYEQQAGIEITTTGIWLDESGILAASPDGLIGDDALIEIKCPYSYRDKTLQNCLTRKDILTASGRFQPISQLLDWSVRSSRKDDMTHPQLYLSGEFGRRQAVLKTGFERCNKPYECCSDYSK